MSVTPQGKSVDCRPGSSLVTPSRSGPSRLTPSSRLSATPDTPVAPRVGGMPITDLMEVFQGMLDAKAAQGKQLKKDIKVDRRTTNEIHNAVADLAKDNRSWDFQSGFRDGGNPRFTEDVIMILGNRMKSVNRDVAYKGCKTYFHTLKRHDKKEKNGNMEKARKAQRKRQRLTNARLRRLSVLKGYKGCSEEESKQLQRSLETTDYISSEESVEEDVENEDSENEAQEKCLIKRPLPWRSELLNLHFEALDKRAKRKQKHKRHGGAQSYKRRVGAASDREEPEDALEYAVADFEEA